MLRGIAVSSRWSSSSAGSAAARLVAQWLQRTGRKPQGALALFPEDLGVKRGEVASSVSLTGKMVADALADLGNNMIDARQLCYLSLRSLVGEPPPPPPTPTDDGDADHPTRGAMSAHDKAFNRGLGSLCDSITRWSRAQYGNLPLGQPQKQRLAQLLAALTALGRVEPPPLVVLAGLDSWLWYFRSHPLNVEHFESFRRLLVTVPLVCLVEGVHPTVPREPSPHLVPLPASDGLAEGEAVVAPVNSRGESIILARKYGQLHGYANRCPHVGVPLNWLEDDGVLDSTNEFLCCSAHHATFRLEDGYCVSGPCAGQSLPKLPLKQHDGQLCIDCYSMGDLLTLLTGRGFVDEPDAPLLGE
eukprot:Sspe_Gene.108643::Locus_87770_Transcript_1_1_Confidence_1.000_Length_1184::g.108643::m.108643